MSLDEHIDDAEGETQRNTLAEPLAREFALAPLGVDLAFEAVEGDLPDHGVEHVLDLGREQRLAFAL